MDSTDMLTFGIDLPVFGERATPDTIRRTAQVASESGFDGVWAGDHVAFPRQVPNTFPGDSERRPPTVMQATKNTYDVFGLLNYLAGITDLHVGSNVCIGPLRHPVMLTKQAFSLEELCDGRFEFGLGVGWLESEYEVLDVPFERRGVLLDEFLDIFRRARTEEIFSFDGPEHSFQEVGFHPVPESGSPRLWIGGYSAPAFRRVAEYGDGWTIKDADPENVESARVRIMDAWMDYDREGEPAVAVGHPVCIDDSRSGSQFLAGSVEHVVEGIRAFESAGATHFILDFSVSESAEFITQIKRFGEEVIPQFR